MVLAAGDTFRAAAVEQLKIWGDRAGVEVVARATGADVPRAAVSSREHYALCRCGHSQNKPFCSGMHWYVEFRDPARSADPTMFEWAGGLPALTRMTRLLYEKHVPADDLLAPLFASMAPGYPQREAAQTAAAVMNATPSGASTASAAPEHPSAATKTVASRGRRSPEVAIQPIHPVEAIATSGTTAARSP